MSPNAPAAPSSSAADGVGIGAGRKSADDVVPFFLLDIIYRPSEEEEEEEKERGCGGGGGGRDDDDDGNERGIDDVASPPSPPPSAASASTSTSATMKMTMTMTADEDSVSPSPSSSSPPPPPPPHLPPLLRKIADKVGRIDESRMTSTPEYLSGSVPNLFSNIRYDVVPATTTTTATNDGGGRGGGDAADAVVVVAARRSTANGVLPSSALLCGTSLGCGLLFLPAATSTSGYIAGTVAAFVAWAYMTISALLTSELLINGYGETGKANDVGLLGTYDRHLGKWGGRLAGVGFLVVSYLVVGVYLSEGGDRLSGLFADAMAMAATTAATDGGGVAGNGIPATTATAAVTASAALGGAGGAAIGPSPSGRAAFAAATCALLSAASGRDAVRSVLTTALVPATMLAFAVAVCVGLPTADLPSLVEPANQHPEYFLDVFPMLFMGWTYHGVVPRVVYDLEGDKDKITRAIVLGEWRARAWADVPCFSPPPPSSLCVAEKPRVCVRPVLERTPTGRIDDGADNVPDLECRDTRERGVRRGGGFLGRGGGRVDGAVVPPPSLVGRDDALLLPAVALVVGGGRVRTGGPHEPRRRGPGFRERIQRRHREGDAAVVVVVVVVVVEQVERRAADVVTPRRRFDRPGILLLDDDGGC